MKNQQPTLAPNTGELDLHLEEIEATTIEEDVNLHRWAWGDSDESVFDDEP